MSSDNSLTYVTVLGPGEIASQTLYLIRSIHTVEEEPDIIVFTAEGEKHNINTSIIEEIRQKAELHTVEIPVEHNPITAKIAALSRAVTLSDSNYLLLLDTDILMLDKIELHHESDADIFLKPAASGRLYWPSQESQLEWERLADIADVELPDYKITSTVEKLPIRPYWNSGVILMKNNSQIPEEWLRIVTEIEGKISHEFFLDQVALALAVSDQEVEPVSEEYNFPGNFRLRCPPGTVNIHYRSYPHLYKLMLFNPWLIEEVAETGVIDRIDAQKDLYFYWDVLYKIARNAKIKLLGFR